MIFFYSRKPLLVMLVFWLIGMAFVYTKITGDYPDWLEEINEQTSVQQQEVRLGHSPEVPAAVKPSVQSNLHLPSPDLLLNRCIDLKLLSADSANNTLTLELDYVAAQKNGFSTENLRSYYLSDSPTFVIALGEPWVADSGNITFTRPLPQISSINMIISKSRNLRLLVHTGSMHIAKNTKLKASPAGKGIKLEIQLPR